MNFVQTPGSTPSLIEVLTDIGIDLNDEDETIVAGLRFELEDLVASNADFTSVNNHLIEFENDWLGDIQDSNAKSDIETAFSNFRKGSKHKAKNGTSVSDEEKKRDIEVANTILQQIGGMGALKMMTGAYNFIALKNGVSFRIKNQRANYIKIMLTSMDLYDVEIGRIRGFKYTIVEKAEGLYFDQLKGFIEKVTGMTLTVPRFRKEGGMAEDGKMIRVPKVQKEAFVNYVYEFYDHEYPRVYVGMAVDEYLRSIAKEEWGGGDSFDREKVYRFLSKYPTNDWIQVADGKEMPRRMKDIAIEQMNEIRQGELARMQLIRDMMREAERTMSEDEFLNLAFDYSVNESSSESLQWWVIDNLINDLRYSDRIKEFISRAKALGWADQYARDGRSIADQNYEMVQNQNKQIKHHAKELDEVLKKHRKRVPAWVLSKTTRASNDMSDVTHYLDGLKAADGNYISKAGDSVVRLQQYLVAHGGFITIHGSNYGYYSHTAYNLRVVGNRGAIYNIIPYFPKSSPGNLQDANFFSLIRAKKATNFAITPDGELIDIVEDGIRIRRPNSFFYTNDSGVEYNVVYEWDRDFPIIISIYDENDNEIDMDLLSEDEMMKISADAYTDYLSNMYDYYESRREAREEGEYRDGGGMAMAIGTPDRDDPSQRPRAATANLKEIVFKKKTNPQITITVRCYPNMQIVEIINERNIRFPYSVGQVLNMGHRNWACVNGWLVNDKDVCPEKKVMGIRVSDIPQGHPLRYIYPHKFK